MGYFTGTSRLWTWLADLDFSIELMTQIICIRLVTYSSLKIIRGNFFEIHYVVWLDFFVVQPVLLKIGFVEELIEEIEENYLRY